MPGATGTPIEYVTAPLGLTVAEPGLHGYSPLAVSELVMAVVSTSAIAGSGPIRAYGERERW